MSKLHCVSFPVLSLMFAFNAWAGTVPAGFVRWPNGGGWVDPASRIHPSAYIDTRSVAGPGVTIGENVQLIGSTFSGGYLENDTTVVNSQIESSDLEDHCLVANSKLVKTEFEDHATILGSSVEGGELEDYVTLMDSTLWQVSSADRVTVIGATLTVPQRLPQGAFIHGSAQ